ncbi:PIN domain-containing protein [Streptomyces sp. NPDC001919]
MLIFDTNAVNEMDPHGAKADLLRLLGKAGIDVAVPWVVLEELTAHKLYDYQRSFDMMRRRHQELAELTPNLAGAEPKFQGAEFAEYWRRQYRDIFTIIPTSHGALQQAVLREAACMKPAKVDKTKKSGGRDVAVWFSILEYLDQNPQKVVHFVSANTSDFGEPDQWPFPLDIDLEGKGGRISHLLNFESALEKFAQPAEAPEGIQDALTQRLSVDKAKKELGHELWVRHLRRLFGWKGKSKPTSLHAGISFSSMEPAECRKIGNSVYFWAKVSWQVFALPPGAISPVIASWDTSVLFPEDEQGGISLLRSGSLAPISASELSEEIGAQLSEALQDERDALAEDDLQDSNAAHAATAFLDDSATSTWSPVLKGSRVRSDLRESAFLYERRVIESLQRNFEKVRLPSMDLGFAAVILTREGVIGVAIQYGPRTSGLLAPGSLPRSLGSGLDAMLVVSNRPAFATVDHVFPVETVQWNGASDNEELVRRVKRIRHALSSF